MNNSIGIKIFFKKILLYILALVGYFLLIPFWPCSRKNKLIILRYHSINDYRRHEVNVKIAAFKKQMAFLVKYYKVLSLKEAVEILKNKAFLPKNSVAITFDDGYKDNYVNAYPILKQLKIPATIFLTTDYIDTDRILPHDLNDNPSYNKLLSWNEVREMVKGGIEFGSHTISHANLGRDNNIDIKSEIEESKKIIEQELGRSAWVLSYPFGLINDFSDEVKRMVLEAGYTCGCSAMNGTNDSEADIFELRRIGIEASDNMFTFRAKLNGALDLLEIKDWPVFNKILKIFNKIIGV